MTPLNPSPDHAGPEFFGRVDSAQAKLHELAQRIELFFAAMAEPAPPPPWSRESAVPQEVELEHSREIERLSQRARSCLDRADSAEQRTHELEAELEAVQRQFGRMREQLRVAQTPAGVDPDTFQELERELNATRHELSEVRKAHGVALEQMAMGASDDRVTEDSVVRAMRAEESVQKMQQHMQHQLLEQEELRRSRDEMRMANQRLRNELRVAQQKRDMYKERAEGSQGSTGQVQDLRSQLGDRDKAVAELQAQLKTLKRDLDTQEKREQHLRRHLSGRGSSR